MVFLQDLYHAHIQHIAKVNKWYTYGECAPDYRAWLRAETYLRLDMLITNLQIAFLPNCILPGDSAVLELVSRQTGLPIIQAHRFSFAEALVALQPALEAVKIPPALRQYPPHVLKIIKNEQWNSQIELPPYSRDEWDHSLMKKCLDKHMHR